MHRMGYMGLRPVGIVVMVILLQVLLGSGYFR